MAFALGKIERPCLPQTGIVWLSRTDQESLNQPTPKDEPGIERTDWLDEPYTKLHERNKFLSNEIKVHIKNHKIMYSSLVRTYNPLVKQRFLRGCKTLSKGGIVITDRLHAHILCLLMGIPHIIFDNSYGKIKGYYETWTKNNALTIWASSIEEAIKSVNSDQHFRFVLIKKGIDLASLDNLINRLKISADSKKGWTTPDEEKTQLWLDKINQVQKTILEFIPKKQSFILADENLLHTGLNLPYHTVIPFLERNHQYFGPPPEDDTAISELERLKDAGSNFLVIAWPSFWWLEYYSKWYNYLCKKYKVIMESENIILFDLRK